MTEKFFAERLFEAGFDELVSVIPPGAQLAPTSKIPQAAVGKIPGRRAENGLWAGYNWRTHEPTIDDVKRWCIAGANIGLRASFFPAVDIDCTDANLATVIEDAALGFLGAAPIRIGRAPKRLLMYTTLEPFGRMRLVIERPNGEKHLVEILGHGQQYLVGGTHPATGQPYQWLTSPLDMPITEITRDQADAFLEHLASIVSMLGLGTVKRIGDGRKTETIAAADQQALRAPTIDVLREAVQTVPNNDDTAPTRDEYVRMGYAIRAAGDADPDEAFNIFAEWAGKHDADGRVAGNPETWLSDWRRFNPPYSVGWAFIAELARGYGYNDAALEFDVIAEAPTADEKDKAAPLYSDQWLAEKIVDRHRPILRYVPQKGSWMVWENARWKLDAELQAEDIIKRALKMIALEVEARGVTPKEIKEYEAHAKAFTSAGKLQAVAQLVKSDRAIAVSMSSLDHNPWVLNTPAGVVELTEGAIVGPDPDALCTKQTAVPPDFSSACPEWKRFLAEITGNNQPLERYLQRLCGYALTGSTREQHLSFIFGPGGNGKSVFLNALGEILGDYAHVASMDTFTSSNNEKHTTDIAAMVGKRLVTASETAAGKRWDEQRVKSATGGEPMTARYMRQDNFTFRPQFKLVFTGNHKPELRDVGKSMRRRLQLVPFTVTPARVDTELDAKLREEYPAILAWMIEGCVAWQAEGLNPPAIVRDATDEYFEEEDVVGRWMSECVEVESGATATTRELFQSWTEWANANRLFVGSDKRLASTLTARKFDRWTEPGTRRKGFAGIRLKDRQDSGLLV